MGVKPDFDDVTTIDEAPAKAGALVVFRPATLVAYSDGILDAVERVAAEARARVAGADVSTAEGREVIRSTAYKVARSKTALDDLGAELVAEQKRTAAAVDASRRDMRGKLDALKDEVRHPLTEFEEREVRRVAEHEAELARIEALTHFDFGTPTVGAVENRLAALIATPSREWEEFKQRANETLQRVQRDLDAKLAAARKAEAEAAELARLRAEQAAREQRERDERIAREAADRATREAEEKAARERQAELDRLAENERLVREARELEQRERDASAAAELERERRAKADAEERAAKAERDAADAVKREQARAAAAKAAEEEAARKREANKRHLAKINREIVDVLCALIPELSPELARAVVTQIALGKFDRVKISY